MAQVTGAFGRVVVDKEVSYGVTKVDNSETPVGWIIPFTTCGVGKDQNLLESNTISSSRDPQEPGLGQINITGDLAVELNANSHGRLIYFALGDYTVSSITGAYQHTFKIGSSCPSFCLESRFSDGAGFTKYYLYKGCKISQWTLNARTDSYIESTFSIIGSTKVVSDTEYDDSLDNPGHGPFTDYNAAIYIGGSQVGIVTEMSFTLNNNLDENTFTIGGGSTRTALPEGRVSATGSATMQFTDDTVTYIDLAESATKTSLKLTLTRGSGDGTANNEYMEIYFPEIKLRPPREEIPGPQGIFLTFDFIAFDTDGDSAVKVLLKNQVSDYSV